MQLCAQIIFYHYRKHFHMLPQEVGFAMKQTRFVYFKSICMIPLTNSVNYAIFMARFSNMVHEDNVFL